MKVGLDFGTSNSSVAVYDGQQIRLLPIDNHGERGEVLRSVLYIGRDGSRSVGQRAIETYFEQNTGRSVRYALKFIRVLQMTFAEVGTVEVPAYARIDENEPGRLFQSLKSFLRDISFKGTSVFGQTYSLEDLIAVLLTEIRLRTEDILGERVEEWVIGRPVRYADRPDADTLAMRRMTEACRRAGMERVRFEPEPIAAGRHFALQAKRPGTALVFDMGGGTLDLTVLTVGEKWQVLATEGVPVAGDVFDSHIVEGCVVDHFGLNATMGPGDQPFPVHIPLTLTDWASIVGLNDPKTLDTIRVARRTSPQQRQIAALECLVTRNYGLTLYEEVRRAKAELSSRERDEISMQVEEIHFRQEISRRDFEGYIAAECRRIEGAVDRVIAAAGLKPDQIDVVLRTGGSSSIPWFIAMLERKVGPRKVIERDVFTSVAAGLAISAGSAGA
jgi:hypothetical chaperone protein